MSGKHKTKNQLIPKTLSDQVIQETRDSFIYIRQRCSLSYVLYLIRVIVLIIQVSLPALLFRAPNLWHEGRVTTNIVRFLSFFLQFGALFDGVISLIIASVIMVVSVLYNMILGRIYRVQGVLNRHAMFISLLLFEVIIPCITPWVSAQIAMFINLLIYEEFKIFAVTGIIILLLLFSLLFIQYHFLYSPIVMYNQKSSLFWLGNDNSRVLFFTLTIGFLGCSAEGAKGTYQIVMDALLLIVMTYLSVFAFMNPLFINPQYAFVISSVVIGTTIVGFVQFLRIIFLDLDQDVIILLLFPCFIISFIVSRIVFTKRRVGYITILDAEEVNLKSENKFLNMLRVGFQTGHPYVLTWKPCQIGLEKWPKSQDIYYQCLRFIAIYPEENIKFLELTEKGKELYKKDLFIKGIRKIAMSIIKSRNKHMNHEIRHKAKELDKLAKNLRATSISYWSAISEDSVIGSYDLASQAYRLQTQLEAEYLRLISNYPNNSYLAEKFGNVLAKIEGDIKEAQVWYNRSKSLVGLIDYTFLFGRKTFPSIPPYLESFNPENEVSANNSHSNSMFSQQSSQASIFDDGLEENEEHLQTINIRELGSTATIPFIRNIVVFLIVFFILFVLILPILITIPVLMASIDFNNAWDIGYALSDLSSMLSKSSYSVFLSCVRAMNIFPDELEEAVVLGIEPHGLSLEQTIVELRTIISNQIDQVLSVVSNINVDGDGKNFFTQKIKVKTHSYTTEVSILEASNGFSAKLYQYDEAQAATFMGKEWFEFIVDNSFLISTSILDVVTSVNNDIGGHLGNAFQISTILIIVVGILLAFLEIFFIFLLIKMKRSWKVMIDSFSKIPLAAIHKTIASFSTISAKKSLHDDERLYNSDFIKMATARDSFGGIPIYQLLILFTFLIVFSIASCIQFILTAQNRTSFLMTILPRYMTLSHGVAYINEVTTLMHRYIAAATSPFHEDTQASLLATINSIFIDLESYFDEILIGQKDGASYGFLSTNDETIASLIFNSSSLSSEEPISYHTFLGSMSLFQLVNIMTDLSATARNDASRGLLDNTNYYLILLTHVITDHWTEDIGVFFGKKYDDYVNTAVPAANSEFIGFPFIFSGVGIIILVIMFYYLSTMTKVIHYCLANLCMVDPKIVLQTPTLSNLLSGNFTVEPTAESMKSALERIQEVTDEIVFLLNSSNNIISKSQAAITNWKSDQADEDIQLIITFKDPEVEKNIFTCIEAIDVVTDIILVHDQREINVKVHAVPMSNNGLILVFNDLSERNEKIKKLEEEKARMNEIRRQIIPKNIQKFINPTANQLTYVSKYTAILCIRFSDLDKMKTFREILKECLAKSSNAALSKGAGVCEFIIFNQTNDDQTKAELVREAINLAKCVCDKMKEVGQVQIGLASETNVTCGMIHADRMSFDIYARCVNVVRLLAKSASPNSILIERMDVNYAEEIPDFDLTQRVIDSRNICIYTSEHTF